MDSFSSDKIISLDLVKNWTQNDVYCRAPTVYELGSQNSIGILVSRCRCALGITLADSFNNDRIIVLTYENFISYWSLET